jgi:photosystem II stability/assembly factor-like uncharacterized protein
MKLRCGFKGAIILLLGTLGLVVPLQAGIDVWSPLGFNQNVGGTIYDFTVNPLDRNVIYVITSNLYRTSNGGGSWTQDLGLPPDFETNCVAIDPVHPSNVYVGDYRGLGIYKSTVGGGSWTPLNLNLAASNDAITRIVVDPVNPNMVIASTWWGYIYRSTDGGSSWTQTQLPNTDLLKNMIINPQNHNILYVASTDGSADANLFRSNDNGVSWTLTNRGLENLGINGLAIDPTNPNVLYAATQEQKVFKSTNSGDTWTASSYGITSPDNSTIIVTSVAVSLFDHNQVFATTQYNGIYRSLNGGASWRPFNNGIEEGGSPFSGCDFLRTTPQDPATLYTVADVSEIYQITVTTTMTLFVPVILDSPGLAGSHYTSELTLTNKGSKDANVHFAYTATSGGGTGTADIVLPARHQITQPNAIDYLRSLGLGFDNSSRWLGTLSVNFGGISSSTDVAVTVRTTTATSGGQAGLAYAGAPADSLLTGSAYICGLHQTNTDRSNVAFQHAGTNEDGEIVLWVTIYPADPTLSPSETQQISLQPGEFKQLNAVLNTISASEGYVKVERISGNAPYYAYGVVNDAFNSDGSFITPKVEPPNIPTGMTLPVAVEGGVYSTEVVLTNYDKVLNIDKTLTLSFVAGNVNAPNHTASATVFLPAGGQQTISSIITYLRNHGAAAALPTGTAYAGPLFVTSSTGDMTGIAVGARTSNPNINGQGRFGLFYPAVPYGNSSVSSAWLFGLQQNSTNRTNLAIINTGETNDEADSFEIDIYDADTGELVTPPVTTDNGKALTFAAKEWRQLNMILANHSSGISNAYAHVRKVGGSNPFITYGVVNDGATPGQRTGDGAFIASSQ